jgi:hypothetical protein
MVGRRALLALPAAVTLAVLLPSTLAAQHPHCRTVPYSVGNLSQIPRTFPHDYPRLPLTDPLIFLFNLPAPPPGSPTCRYEISDITVITMSFTTVGQAEFRGNRIGDNVPGPNAPLPHTGLIGGGTGSGTVIFTLPPHQMPGAFELPLPHPPDFPVGLTSFGEFRITAASATIDGTHYFRPVPEPTTAALVAGDGVRAWPVVGG